MRSIKLSKLFRVNFPYSKNVYLLRRQHKTLIKKLILYFPLSFVTKVSNVEAFVLNKSKVNVFKELSVHL